MRKYSPRPDEREPGLALSVLVAVALMLGVAITGGIRFVAQAAEEEASPPVEVEVSLEPVAPAQEAASTPAPVQETAEPETEASPPPAELSDAPARPAAEEPEAEAPSPMTAQQPAPTSTPFALPGNADLMPRAFPINRLNPVMAGVPLPPKPEPQISSTESVRDGAAQDALEPGRAAPELQVLPVGQAGAEGKQGNRIKVALLINHLGVVEGVEILEGSSDPVSDVMAANSLKQLRYRFNPPLPPGQRVLRTEYITLPGNDLP